MGTTIETDMDSVYDFVVSATGIDGNKVWYLNQGQPRPTGGYLSILYVTETPQGLPEQVVTVSEVDPFPITTTTSQMVETTWSMTGYGSEGYVWLDKIRRKWRSLNTAWDTLVAAGVSPANAGDVRNVVQFLDTSFEPRWNVTLKSYSIREDSETTTGQTDQIVVSLEVYNSADVLVAEATLTYPEEVP